MSPGLAAAATLLLAVTLDLAFGDPPNRFHPVAGMGRLLALGRRALCAGPPSRLLLLGGILTLTVAGAAALAGWIVTDAAARLGVLRLGLEAVVLSTMLSVRGLLAAATDVAAALSRGELPAARASVGRHLVGRPTDALDAGQVASATIESVAENLTDSVIAPACFFLAFGLPGAMAYRAINTADAMLGYREGVLEHFGKVAARLDDLLNLLPARLAALSIVTAAAGVEGDATGAWTIMRRDARRTASPNAGWPMAALAGALGVTLEKPGAYRLGDGPPPRVDDIARAARIVKAASVFGLATVIVVAIVID